MEKGVNGSYLSFFINKEQKSVPQSHFHSPAERLKNHFLFRFLKYRHGIQRSVSENHLTALINLSVSGIDPAASLGEVNLSLKLIQMEDRRYRILVSTDL